MLIAIVFIFKLRLLKVLILRFGASANPGEQTSIYEIERRTRVLIVKIGNLFSVVI